MDDIIGKINTYGIVVIIAENDDVSISNTNVLYDLIINSDEYTSDPYKYCYKTKFSKENIIDDDYIGKIITSNKVGLLIVLRGSDIIVHRSRHWEFDHLKPISIKPLLRVSKINNIKLKINE